MDSPAVQALTEMTQLIASLDNDLHSYRKEEEESHTAQNIVNVLIHHEQFSMADAIRRSTAIRDRIMGRFLRLRDSVFPDAGPAPACYLTGLGHAIRDNIDWAAGVPRYLSNGVPTQRTAPRAMTTTDEPHDASTEPLPGVSWWWDPLA